MWPAGRSDACSPVDLSSCFLLTGLHTEAHHGMRCVYQEPLWSEEQELQAALLTPYQDGQQVSDDLMYIQADSTPSKSGIADEGKGCETVSSQRQDSPSPVHASADVAAIPVPFSQPLGLPAILEEDEAAQAGRQQESAAAASPPKADLRQTRLSSQKPRAAKSLFGTTADQHADPFNIIPKAGNQDKAKAAGTPQRQDASANAEAPKSSNSRENRGKGQCKDQNKAQHTTGETEADYDADREEVRQPVKDRRGRGRPRKVKNNRGKNDTVQANPRQASLYFCLFPD